MKYVNLIFMLLTGIVFLIHSGNNDSSFLPHLPFGEFRVNLKAILKCNNSPNSDVEQYVYLNKISKYDTAIKGNMTVKKPLDDSYTININFALKDLIGGWKDNAHVLNIPKACSSMKNYLGSIWYNISSTSGLKNSNCPIQPGVYNINNLYAHSNLSNTNIPKYFFYGTYKIRFYLTDIMNLQHGCIAYVVELKRPWEIE